MTTNYREPAPVSARPGRASLSRPGAADVGMPAPMFFDSKELTNCDWFADIVVMRYSASLSRQARPQRDGCRDADDCPGIHEGCGTIFAICSGSFITKGMGSLSHGTPLPALNC